MDFYLLRKLLTDKKSKIYFDARLQFLSDNRISSFYQTIRQANEYYNLREVECFKKENDISSWIVYGDDDYAKYNCMILNDCSYQVVGITTNEFLNLFDDNVKVMDSLNILENLNNGKTGLIVNKRDYSKIPKNIQRHKNILVLYSHVVGRSGIQYFDYFTPIKNESFLDAGALDGNTTKAFISWCNGKYDKVYAFEPNPITFNECNINLKVYSDKVKLFKYALWDCSCELLFDNTNSKWDARVKEDGNVMVEGESIDHLLYDENITFLKFDVEGCEIKALKGAEKFILKNVPRMAISVYHKDYDLFEIMGYLSKLIPEYKYAIRHYHSDLIETILYVYR